MGGAALGWRGETVRGRGILMKSRLLFPFFMGYIQNRSLIQDSINQIAHPFIWITPGWVQGPLRRFEAFCLPLFLLLFFFFFTSFPLFHFSSPSIGIYMSMTSCVSAFLFFSVAYLHVSGFCCLMVLRWDESNLLCDSLAILPAITLIHSGQWILMTMKPGSCEDILQALVLVMLVWLSWGGGSPAPFTPPKRVYFSSTANQVRPDIVHGLNNNVRSHFTSSKLLWKPHTCTKKKKRKKKKQFRHEIMVLPSEGLEIRRHWRGSLKIKTNLPLISSTDCAAKSVKSLLQKWFEEMVEDGVRT